MQIKRRKNCLRDFEGILKSYVYISSNVSLNTKEDKTICQIGIVKLHKMQLLKCIKCALEYFHKYVVH